MASPSEQRAALGQLLELVLLLGDDMEQRLAREGLSPARIRVIWTLHLQGASSQRIIAEALGVTPRNVTGLVDGLEESGFVMRTPHPRDRRALLVSLTPKADRIVADLRAEESEFAALLFDNMAKQTFQGLVDGLGSILDVIRAELAAVEASSS